jgi:hypothetical protein
MDNARGSAILLAAALSHQIQVFAEALQILFVFNLLCAGQTGEML